MPDNRSLGNFPILYFSRKPSRTLARFNDGGADRYWVFDAEGGWWDSVAEETESLDFNLERWMDAGRLFWIAPGDEKLRLCSETAGCPYLSVEGRRTFLHIRTERSGSRSQVQCPSLDDEGRPHSLSLLDSKE